MLAGLHATSRCRLSTRAALLLLVFSGACPPAFLFAYDDKYGSVVYGDEGPRWDVFPAANIGYNQLLKGYQGYENLGNAGVDLYVLRRPPEVEEPKGSDRLGFRISADYFPLQVPEGVYNTTEDIFSLNAAVLYRFYSLYRPEQTQYIPFVGIGAGAYRDVVTVDTPASGKVSGTHSYLGFSGSLGVFLPVMGAVRFAPEIRLHALRIPDNGLALNMTYQVAASLRLGRKP
jgi:hypothetical protein